MNESDDRRILDDGDAMPDDARQHMRAARAEWRASVSSFFPPEFVQHQRRARREMLLAWRSFLDRAIQRVDDRIDASEARATQDRADRPSGTSANL